jgi:hypothetical protein
MFTPAHLLPRFDPEKLDLYQRRWEKEEGPALRKKILEMIRESAGEDFLQWDFENKKLGFIESESDLKGINIFKEDMTFPPDGSGWFEGTDFSYAQFYHSKFRRATFSANFSFARIYNCEFVDCSFSFSAFYGATLEKVRFINCDFVEQNAFTNCDLREVEFKNCFIPDNIFVDCRFDASTVVENPIKKPRLMKNLTFDRKKQAEIFRGIKEAYTAGGVVKQSRNYFFRKMQAITRHNAVGLRDTLSGYLFEYVAGYGVRPLRVLTSLLVSFVSGVIIFSPRVGFHNALILTAGGFFTFGGYVDLLKGLCIWYQLWYILTAFLGMLFTGLYISVWANVWLRER